MQYLVFHGKFSSGALLPTESLKLGQDCCRNVVKINGCIFFLNTEYTVF